MYEVKMTFEKLVQYFKVHDIKNDGYYLEPINDDISDYVKNITRYSNGINDLIFKTKISENDVLYRSFISFLDILVFTFENEEEAFYFKLKFC